MISVCLASYNGSAFIEEQARSVLEQLGPADELIVADDCSSDDTLEILRQIGDPRLSLHPSPRRLGHVQNFARAMALASGHIVLLADQDDLWPEGRVGRMLRGLERGRVVAADHDLLLPDGSRQPSRWTLPMQASGTAATRSVRNIAGLFLGRRSYYGCAMGLRADFLEMVLPVPGYVEAHDHWIALAGNLVGTLVHEPSIVVHRRVHARNLTGPRRSIKRVSWTRVLLCLQVFHLACRLVRLRLRRLLEP